MGANWSAPIRNIFAKNKKEDQTSATPNVEVIVKQPSETSPPSNLAEELAAAEEKSKKIVEDDERPEEIGTPEKHDDPLQSLKIEKEQLRNEFYKIDNEIEQRKDEIFTKLDEKICNLKKSTEQKKEDVASNIQEENQKIFEVLQTEVEKTHQAVFAGLETLKEKDEKLEQNAKKLQDNINAEKEEIHPNVVIAEKMISDDFQKIFDNVEAGKQVVEKKSSVITDNLKKEIDAKKEEISSDLQEKAFVAEKKIAGFTEDLEKSKVELIDDLFSNLQKIEETGERKLSEGIENLHETLDSNKPKVQEVKNEILSALSWNIRKTEENPMSVEVKLQDELVGKKDDFLSGFTSHIQEIEDKTSRGVENLESSLENVKQITDTGKEKQEEFLGFGVENEKKSIFENIPESLVEFNELVSDEYEKISENMVGKKNVSEKIQETVSAAEKNVLDSCSKIENESSSKTHDIKSSFGEFKDLLSEEISSEDGKLTTDLGKVSKNLGSAIVSEREEVATQLRNFEENLSKNISTKKQELATDLDEVSQKFGEALNSQIEETVTKFSDFEKNLSGKVSAKKEELNTGLEKFSQNVNEDVVSKEREIASKFNDFAEDLSANVPAYKEKVTSSLKDFKEEFVAKKEEVATKLNDLEERSKQCDLFSKVAAQAPIFQSTQQPLDIMEEEHTASLKKQKELEEKVLKAQRAFESSTLLTEDFLKTKFEETKKIDDKIVETVDFLNNEASEAGQSLKIGISDAKNEAGKFFSDLNAPVTEGSHQFGVKIQDRIDVEDDGENEDTTVLDCKALMK